MANRLRELVDLRWSDAGDLVLDTEDGDLLDTKKENFQSVVQHIETRLQSTRGDWKTNPMTGASLKQFAGRPSTPELGKEVETAILNELTRGGLFTPNEILVQAFPISQNGLACMIFLTPSGQRETMRIVISYDLQDNKVSLRN